MPERGCSLCIRSQEARQLAASSPGPVADFFMQMKMFSGECPAVLGM